MRKKDWFIVSAVSAVLLLSDGLGSLGGLGASGVKALILMGAAILLLATEAIPVGVTGLLTVALPPLMGLCGGLQDSASYFFSPIFFFLLSVFGIAAAMGNVPLTRRMLCFFLERFGTSTQLVIFAILVSLAITSSVIANFPALILFMGIACDFLEIYEREADRKRTGRVLMISLPLASSIGGMTTPVGSAQMMLGMEFLQKSGRGISFVQWMALGVPAAVVLLPLTYFVLLKLFKPVELSKEDIRKFRSSIVVPKKLQKNEKYLLAILSVLVVGWILSPLLQINIMYVSFLGLILMLVPGFKIMDWKTYNEHVNWSTIFMVCGVMGLSSILIQNGVSQWMMELLLKTVPSGISETGMIMILGLIIFLVLIVIPNGIAVVSLICLPIVGMTQELGLHPVPVIVSIVTFATFAIIIPLEPVYFLTYSTGYYKMRDMARQGILNSLLIIVVIAIWYPAAVRMLGW